MLTPAGVVTAVSGDWTALVPDGSDGPTGCSFADLVDSDHRDECSRAVQLAMAGTAQLLCFRTGGAEGRDWHATLAPFPSAEEPAGVAVFTRSSAIVDAARTRIIGRAIRTVGHDLNNLLTIIVGLNGLLMEQADSSRIPLYTAEIGKAADRAARLAFELVTLGRRPEAATLINPNGLLTELEPLIARLAGSVALEIELDPGMPPVTAERSGIVGVLVELMTCAAVIAGPESRICLETLMPPPGSVSHHRCVLRLRVAAAARRPDASVLAAVRQAAAAIHGTVQLAPVENLSEGDDVLVDVALLPDERWRPPTPQ